MRSPWNRLAPLELDREYVVLASSIPPRRRTSTWRLFRGASSVRKQLARTDGVIGFSLLARPLKKQYATLSIWEDQDALRAFSDSSPHRELVTHLSAQMNRTRFVSWTINGSDGRPTWNEALQKLR